MEAISLAPNECVDGKVVTEKLLILGIENAK